MHVVEDLLKICWFLHISPVRLKAPYNGSKWLKNAASRHSKYIFRTEDEIIPLQLFSVENICGVAWSEMYVASTPHPSFQIVVGGGEGGGKIFWKNYVEEGQKKKKKGGGCVMRRGQLFQDGGQRIFQKNGKLHNHSIKSNYSN